MYENYLQHHGILGQRWGVRRFQPYPKGHKGGKEIGKAAKAERITRRATRKLSRIDRKVSGEQRQANKYYDKAIRKSTSLFGSQRKVSAAVNRASASQQKAYRLESKGVKYYKKVQRKMDRLGIETSNDLKEIGQRYMKSMNDKSRAMYNSMMVGGSIKYKGW